MFNLKKFEKDGYIVLDNFISVEECQRLVDEIGNIIESKIFLDDLKKLPAHQYFLESNDKIRGFLESKAELKNHENSKLIYKRIGYGLHALNPYFKSITYNEKTEVKIKLLSWYLNIQHCKK